MNWIDQFQLFLFDFDGLLVDTEPLHYKAYKRMFARYGENLSWNFQDYCAAAHRSQEDLRIGLEKNCPGILDKESDWTILYQRKKEELLRIVEEEPVPCKPGAKGLLEILQKRNIRHAIVTHSPRVFLDLVLKQHPVLRQIPHLITREDYAMPKPDPECYETAIRRFSKEGQRVIGFEDTPRGLQALLATSAEAVYVPSVSHPFLPNRKPFVLVPSLQILLENGLPAPVDTPHA